MKNLFVVAFMLATFSLYSQNYMFDQNSSGFSLSGQLTSQKGSTLIAIIPAYTIDGKLSFGLGIGYESSDYSDGSSIILNPYIDYLVLKQDEVNNPVSVSIGGAYQYNTFSEYDGLTGGIIKFGSSIFHEIKASDAVNIIPGASVGWSKSSLYYDGVSEKLSSGISYGLFATVKFNKFYIKPELQFYKGNSTFSLGFGLLFPK